MKILFDHQIFSYQKFGGASRYFAELMNVFFKNPNIEFSLGVIESPNEYLSRSLYYKGKIVSDTGLPGFVLRYLRNEFQTRCTAKLGNYDVLHATFYDPTILKSRCRSKLVVTVLDMIPERFPEFFNTNGIYGTFVTKRWIEGKRKLCQEADAVLTISQSTKDDLVSFYDIDPKRVTVTHLGNRLTCDPSQPHLANLPDQYILYVGTRNTYKNFRLFISAAAPLLHATPGLSIVCVGGGKFSSDEADLLTKHALSERVFQRNVPEAEIAVCYSKALAFVFPSLYEGFGIPILEAMNCGCPTLLAQASCFPEIAADAALYFDTTQQSSLTEQLGRLLTDNALRDQLRSKGLVRAAGFSWESTARQTLAIYQSLE